MQERIIGHLDLDAFFASVEEREKPYLKGLPVVIGADPKGGRGRGVVSTANYAARRYGIKSALSISTAWRLSESARERGEAACAFITPRHGKYTHVSREVFDIVARHIPTIEQVSIDEAYLDLSHCGSYTKAIAAARAIRRAVRTELQLTCSIGLAPNKLIAKIASDAAKPDGLMHITPQSVDAFLTPLPVGAIPGIGPKAVARLARDGVYTIKDAHALGWEKLEELFGTWGFGMYERLRGIDERPVAAEERVRKSIGKHHTFDADTTDMEEVFSVLREQAERIVRTMRRRGFGGFRTTALTVRFDDYTTCTRSLTVPTVLSSGEALELKAVKLALPFFDARENPHGKAIRLIGLRIEKLT